MLYRENLNSPKTPLAEYVLSLFEIYLKNAFFQFLVFYYFVRRTNHPEYHIPHCRVDRMVTK